MEAVARFQTGDGSAIADILEAARPTIGRAVGRTLAYRPSWAEPVDLRRQAEILVLRYAKTWKPTAPFLAYVETYLFLHLRRWCFRERMACGKNRTSNPDVAWPTLSASRYGAEPTEHDPDVALWITVAKAPHFRTVVAHAVEGRSFADIAARRGVPKSSVFDEYKKGVAWLRAELAGTF